MLLATHSIVLLRSDNRNHPKLKDGDGDVRMSHLMQYAFVDKRIALKKSISRVNRNPFEKQRLVGTRQIFGIVQFEL